MILNGEVPIVADTVIYTVPSPTPGAPRSGSIQEINLFRFVSTIATNVTLTIWLNVNGTKRLLTPNALVLTPGAAWDDVPIIQLPVGGQIIALASLAGVDWTINRYFVDA